MYITSQGNFDRSSIMKEIMRQVAAGRSRITDMGFTYGSYYRTKHFREAAQQVWRAARGQREAFFKARATLLPLEQILIEEIGADLFWAADSLTRVEETKLLILRERINQQAARRARLHHKGA